VVFVALVIISKAFMMLPCGRVAVRTKFTEFLTGLGGKSGVSELVDGALQLRFRDAGVVGGEEGTVDKTITRDRQPTARPIAGVKLRRHPAHDKDATCSQAQSRDFAASCVKASRGPTAFDKRKDQGQVVT
jgi:hypothetical protein